MSVVCIQCKKCVYQSLLVLKKRHLDNLGMRRELYSRSIPLQGLNFDLELFLSSSFSSCGEEFWANCDPTSLEPVAVLAAHHSKSLCQRWWRAWSAYEPHILLLYETINPYPRLWKQSKHRRPKNEWREDTYFVLHTQTPLRQFLWDKGIVKLILEYTLSTVVIFLDIAYVHSFVR